MERNCKQSEHEERVKSVKKRFLSDTDVQKICNVFRVLSDATRLKIVESLKGGELCVYHIVEVCGGTQSAISHQLRILKDNRVVKSRRDGQNILYSIADEHIFEILKMSEEHLRCDEGETV